MKRNAYLYWLLENTKTTWWHDSGDPAELDAAIEDGASGVTTNPVLSALALTSNRDKWKREIQDVLSGEEKLKHKAELLMKIVLTDAAKKMQGTYEKTGGKAGYVCAQVDPARAGQREQMSEMARRFHTWAPNIAVKLPVTLAGLDVLEECIADGITVTATVSFTVPQVVAIAERYEKGAQRAAANGRKPGHCFDVIMIGRLDDYLRDVIHDNSIDIPEEHIRQAGLAVTKRAYSIYKERSYGATLLVAAMRGNYHMTELSGAELIFSISPEYQNLLQSEDPAQTPGIDTEIPKNVIMSLEKLPEFVRSYEPDGMAPEDFIRFGATQRTLTQFSEVGWKALGSY